MLQEQFLLKNSDKKIKNIFTRVLKGHIAVADYKLKKNTTGSNIDKVARKFLKQINLDYSRGNWSWCWIFPKCS